MKKVWRHIETGAIISDDEYNTLGILAKTNFVPLIQKTRNNDDSYIRK